MVHQWLGGLDQGCKEIAVPRLFDEGFVGELDQVFDQTWLSLDQL